ncbi:uncharacterized protein L201_003735 [Kwoniella dendrophila CBS 6074]|uniref:Uncharacterized protein n=1 Tax=Kwoniella dendrophila CBS 6074 TaxID=1295534 RepID=A0AAX4JTZ2_9TREE
MSDQSFMNRSIEQRYEDISSSSPLSYPSIIAEEPLTIDPSIITLNPSSSDHTYKRGLNYINDTQTNAKRRKEESVYISPYPPSERDHVEGQVQSYNHDNNTGTHDITVLGATRKSFFESGAGNFFKRGLDLSGTLTRVGYTNLFVHEREGIHTWEEIKSKFESNKRVKLVYEDYLTSWSCKIEVELSNENTKYLDHNAELRYSKFHMKDYIETTLPKSIYSEVIRQNGINLSTGSQKLSFPKREDRTYKAEIPCTVEVFGEAQNASLIAEATVKPSFEIA